MFSLGRVDDLVECLFKSLLDLVPMKMPELIHHRCDIIFGLEVDLLTLVGCFGSHSKGVSAGGRARRSLQIGRELNAGEVLQGVDGVVA